MIGRILQTVSDGPYNILFDKQPTVGGPGSTAGKWLIIFFFVSTLLAALFR